MQEDVEIDETRNLISADKVEGTYVYSPKGEHLGHIKTVMLNKRNGRVAYAVLSFGGLFGFGEEYYPLPWEVLTYHTDFGGYVVDLDPNRMIEAPSYPVGQEPDWAEKFEEKIRGFYGAPTPAAV